MYLPLEEEAMNISFAVTVCDAVVVFTPCTEYEPSEKRGAV